MKKEGAAYLGNVFGENRIFQWKACGMMQAFIIIPWHGILVASGIQSDLIFNNLELMPTPESYFSLSNGGCSL